MLAKLPPSRQLAPIDLVAPGFRGLNFSQSGSVLSPQYATKATNCTLDSAGRLAARDGITNLTSTPISGTPTVRTLFEHYRADGTTDLISAYAGGISNAVANPAANDISGTVDDANGRWWFQNFNDKCIGFQAGKTPIVRTGGTFATVVATSGSVPTGEVACAAFGRIWQANAEGTVLYYSGLLDETRWLAEDAGAGTIDMRNVWTQGTDTITAIWAFNGALVVFGNNHIVFWVDGRGSKLGIDPTNLYVSDVIAGTGCVSQYTIQAVGETDLLFLSPSGVQSIKRLLTEKSSPISSLSKYVRDEMLYQFRSETLTNIRSTYNPLYGFYLLSFPTTGVVWVLDQRRRYRDEDGDEVSIVTQWSLSLTAVASTKARTIYAARTAGKIGQYIGDTDEGSTFRFIYQSPWLDLGEQLADRLKMLKRLGAILFVRSNTTVVFKWSADFDEATASMQRTVATGGTASEWNIAEFGLAEWNGGLSLRILKVPARGRAQYFRIGIEADINGEFAVQQAELFTKIGRLA